MFTHTVAYKGIAIPCKRNTLILGLREESLFHPNLMPATIFSDDCHHDEEELDEAAER